MHRPSLYFLEARAHAMRPYLAADEFANSIHGIIRTIMQGASLQGGVGEFVDLPFSGSDLADRDLVGVD